MERQALSILVENTPNVLSHVSGLFSRRGYNIDRISLGRPPPPSGRSQPLRLGTRLLHLYPFPKKRFF
ncbi:ACT domain-containing protein [uncultured Alistipes sp.]|uniref:ACT domain-containing protein n=1 Tax=uncultured Alistipes sp. TaxID=538949 RepID=UPI0034A3B777